MLGAALVDFIINDKSNAPADIHPLITHIAGEAHYYSFWTEINAQKWGPVAGRDEVERLASDLFDHALMRLAGRTPIVPTSHLAAA